jgi:lipid A ethanolaminephosphotransferase
MTVERLALAASLYWLAFANRSFFDHALQGANDQAGWLFGASLAVVLLALHFVVLLLVLNRWTARPLLALLVVISAVASFYVEHLGVYIDVPMINNVLATNVGEARELLGGALIGHLMLYAGVPLLLLSRVRIVRKPLLQSVAGRSMSLVVAVSVMLLAAFISFKPLVGVMRNHKELRYMVTPANWIWATGSALLHDPHVDHRARVAVATDAAKGSVASALGRPRLLVFVVGETARAANWGLNGYSRATTPELARLAVINFKDVTACGTSTEVSLPCMFSLVGRRQYDETRIRHSESLLHVVARAGIQVSWIDNQSGCKGVCDGLPSQTASVVAGDACKGDCLDDVLVAALDRQVEAAGAGTHLVVLHMIGEHGPAYFRRYPRSFERFAPACAEDDLRRCDREAVVNAYDNALAYTDHVLAAMIRRLSQRTDQIDAALLYVSDHGESLGEERLFLHGVPYRIAPDEQLKVPMVMWMSPGYARSGGLDRDCLAARARSPASHDNLAHTVLGLLDVQTRDYVQDLDLTAGCRHEPDARPPTRTVQTAGASS